MGDPTVDRIVKKLYGDDGETEMPEQEKAECWIVQYRIKSKSKPVWEGTRWALHHEYLTEESAVRRCNHMREKAAKRTNDCDEEWRVLHVTQEVVY